MHEEPNVNTNPEANPNHWTSFNAAAIAHMGENLPAAVASLQSAPTIWQQLLTFVLGFLSGVGGSVVIQLGLPPSVHASFPEQFDAFGKPWTFKLKIGGGNLTLSVHPD